MKICLFQIFQNFRIWFICFTLNLKIKLKKTINNLFQCLFFEKVLHGIDIDERVLMMWKKHFDGVPDVLIDNTNILSEKVGDVA